MCCCQGKERDLCGGDVPGYVSLCRVGTPHENTFLSFCESFSQQIFTLLKSLFHRNRVIKQYRMKTRFSCVNITYPPHSDTNNFFTTPLESCPQLLEGHNFHSLMQGSKLVETFSICPYSLPLHVILPEVEILIYHFFHLKIPKVAPVLDGNWGTLNSCFWDTINEGMC